MRPIVVIGEAVADAFVLGDASSTQPQTELHLRVLPGGGPVNTAVALARLGAPARYLGRLSGNPFGRLIRDHLAASGVDLSAAVAAAEQATVALAALDAGGNAVYDFYADGTADWQWTSDELDPRHTSGAACVHTGSMALIREPGGQRIEGLLAAVRSHATISIDPNLRTRFAPAEDYRERLEHWLGLAHLFRLSDQDFAELCPGESFASASKAWHERGIRLAVLTLGAEGSVASLDGMRIAQPALPVEAVDTVGAGDSFTAGLLCWLGEHGHLDDQLAHLQADDVHRALEFAAQVSAFTCGVAGANPPWRDQLTASPA
ncbi:carbohydrate kinase family protein [Flindersiella endophytica]